MPDANQLAQTYRHLDAARDQRVAEANQPSAVEVAMVAAPLLSSLLTNEEALRGIGITDTCPVDYHKIQRIVVGIARLLIAEAERQLDERRERGGD